MHATDVQNPWDTVAIALDGPLPRSNEGNTWLLVMQDRFTKWVEIKPLRKASARAIVTAFKDLIVMRFGCPREVVSDDGRQFISHEFTDLLKEYGITHRRTPVYTPQCNPVERANRVIKTMIAQFVQKTQKIWDQHLPELRFAYNTATSESTA